MLIERKPKSPTINRVGISKKDVFNGSAKSHQLKGTTLNLIGFEYKALREQLVFSEKNMTEGIHLDIITNGAWSLHQVIEHIVKQIEACSMWISTYAIAPKPATALLNLKEKGFLEKIYLLTDRRLSEKKTKGFDILQTICEKTTICENHSKMVALGNDFWNIKISSSANLTENKRLENLTILFSQSAFETTKKIIENGHLD